MWLKTISQHYLRIYKRNLIGTNIRWPTCVQSNMFFLLSKTDTWIIKLWKLLFNRICYRYCEFLPKSLLFLQKSDKDIICTFFIEWLIARSRNFVICKSLFFSSPEHEVLMVMVSFCDRPMSGVRRPSWVIHNFFKHILLLNHWANLDETWQGCSLGEALPKLFKRLNSNHNSGCHGNQKEKKIAKSLRIFSETRRHRALIFGM